MKISKTSDTRQNIVFQSKLEDLPGGLCISVADLTQAAVEVGTPVGKDTNGLGHVIKTAKMQANATNSATDYRVEKGHNFKVGNFFTSGLLKKAFAITAITTTETAYDTITLGTTLGVAVSEGDVMLEALAQATGNTSAYKYTPVGLVGMAFDVEALDNPFTQVVVRGSVIESLCPPIHSDIKTTLSHIRFV